jgi:glutaredoxin
MPTLTLYTRAGCHLCEEMKRVVAAVARRVPLVVEEIDVAADPALERTWGHEVPVLLLDGRRVAKYRVSEARLMRALATSRAGR